MFQNKKAIFLEFDNFIFHIRIRFQNKMQQLLFFFFFFFFEDTHIYKHKNKSCFTVLLTRILKSRMRRRRLDWCINLK